MKSSNALRACVRRAFAGAGIALSAVVFVPAAVAGGQSGSDIVRWVDENGEVHFGQKQFAPRVPAEQLQQVRVAPANGMDVPAGTVYKSRSSGRANVAVVEHKVKKNPRGFRGYNGRYRR